MTEKGEKKSSGLQGAAAESAAGNVQGAAAEQQKQKQQQGSGQGAGVSGSKTEPNLHGAAAAAVRVVGRTGGALSARRMIPRVDSHQFGTTTRVLRTGESADQLEKNKKVALVVGLVRFMDETCRQLAELTAQWNSQPSHEDLMLLEHGQSRDETRRKQREAAAALAEREAPRMKAAMARHEDLMLLEFGQSRAETQRKQREAAAATAEREARRYARSVAEEEVPPPPPQQQRGKTPAVASPLEQLTELLYSFHSPAVASAVTPHAAATGATQPAASTLPLAAYAPQPWATRR